MKKLTKFFVVTALMMAILLVFAACGGRDDSEQSDSKDVNDAPFEGSWKLTKVNSKKYDEERIYTFKEGTCEVKYKGEKQLEFSYRFIKENVLAVSDVPFEQTEPFVGYYQFNVDISGNEMTLTYESSSGSSGKRVLKFVRVEQ